MKIGFARNKVIIRMLVVTHKLVNLNESNLIDVQQILNGFKGENWNYNSRFVFFSFFLFLQWPT